MTSTDHDLARYHEQGFVILRDVLGASETEALRAALQPYLDLGVQGRNDFEGELDADIGLCHGGRRDWQHCSPR